MDDALRNRLWNNIIEDLVECLPHEKVKVSIRVEVFKLIRRDFLVLTMEDMPIDRHPFFSFKAALKDWFFKAEWDERYDLIEYLAEFDVFTKGRYIDNVNTSLKKEVAGYRIIDKTIVQITDEQEIQAIEDAMFASDKYRPVNEHLKAALDLLADRQNPDFRNSIKESISAVEAFCKIIAQDEKATLSKALAIIEKQHSLHSSLKEAYNKLYGYASDADGIRHAMIENGNAVEFEDAKFMLVTCSAFINYLKAKLKL